MSDLRAILRMALNNGSAEFHQGQEEAIQAVIQSPFKALVVQATGWGKSMVYFIATKALRDEGRGPTLVVSPYFMKTQHLPRKDTPGGGDSGHH